MASNDLFENLEDEAFFLDFVKSHFTSAPNAAKELFPCENEVAILRIKLAFSKYTPSLQTYKLLLDSENPDQYKRSGALLNALYKSRIVTAVKFDNGKHGSMDQVESEHPIGISYSDCEYYLKYPRFYKQFYNEILSFDLAYQCCACYEESPTEYTFNYLENVCHYLHTNDDLNVDSLSMMFRSLMH